MDREGYRANAGDRCYFCKAELIETLAPLAAERGIAHVATGTNADDAVAGFRPGIRAAAERGAVTPLLDAGLTKDDVRRASRRWDLPTWDKPAAACLSSRVAYGIEVTPAPPRPGRAGRGRGPAGLAAAGLDARDLRVRDLGERASHRGRRRAARAARWPRGRTPALLDAVLAAGFDGRRARPPRLPLGIPQRGPADAGASAAPIGWRAGGAAA